MAMAGPVISPPVAMDTTLTSKGQVTVPKHIRDALSLVPGMKVRFAVNADGDVVLRPAATANARSRRPADRFGAVRGRADLPGAPMT
jgi:antitoxin PrlF